MSARYLRAAALALVALTLLPGLARADGDPASDMLLAQNVFYPYSPSVSNRLQGQLNAETAAASRAHFPIKVALIASPADLGAIPSLFGKPQQYANFLDREISGSHAQPLLVVMHSGYGTQGLDLAAAIAAVRLAHPAGASSDDLAEAAAAALPKLAAAAGHPIGAVQAAASPGGGPSPVLSLAALAVAAVAASAAIIAVRRHVAKRAATTSRSVRR
jgi:hypothetical protein